VAASAAGRWSQAVPEGGWRQRPAAALSAAQLPGECRARLRELHREQAAPFTRALRELRAPDLQLTAQLLGGVLEAAMGAIESGASLSAVTERTLTMVHAAAGVTTADVP
jgi:hypothetical protein